MREEKLQVLKMIEEGKITAEEGVKLLAAVETEEKKESTDNNNNVKYLMIKVEDLNSGRKKANIKIPFFLVNFGLKFIPKEAKGITQEEINQLIQMAKMGKTGEVLEVMDEEDSVRVKIWLE